MESAFKNLKGEGKLTEINVAQSIKEIRRALVAADVNYKIAKEFTDKIKDEALGSKNILKSVKPVGVPSTLVKLTAPPFASTEIVSVPTAPIP